MFERCGFRSLILETWFCVFREKSVKVLMNDILSHSHVDGRNLRTLHCALTPVFGNACAMYVLRPSENSFAIIYHNHFSPRRCSIFRFSAAAMSLISDLEALCVA